MKLNNKCLIVLLSSLLFIPGCAKEEKKKEIIRPVKSVQVGGIERLTGRSFPGQAKATQEANLSFRVSGPLIEFPVKVGDQVSKGDLLARIDPQDFQVQLQNAAGQLRKAQAALTLAKSDYERVSRIRDKDPGAISESVIDAKKGERDSAQAQVKSLQAAVQGAKDNLAYTYLKAPFAGTVVETYVENFEDVRPKQQIVRLVDASMVEFIVNIPETLILYAPYVTKAWVRFDIYPDQEIPATIKEIGKEASRTTRTYPVTLIMAQPETFQILPGMAGRTVGAEGDLPEISRQFGLEIPISATFTFKDGKTMVWVIDEQTMTVSQRHVVPQQLTDAGVIISEGLEAGEWVATAGVHTLKEGQQVKLMQLAGEEN